MNKRLALVAALSFLVAPLASAHHDLTDWKNALDGAPGDALVAPLGNGPAAMLQTANLPAATWLNDRDGDRIFDSLMQRFQVEATPLVIVTTTSGAEPSTTLRNAQKVAGGFEPQFVYEHLGGFAARLSLPQVKAIATLPDVRQIEWSQPGHPELDTATASMGVRSVQEDLGVDGDRDGSPGVVSREDVIVAILDTGFDGQHVDLRGKFLHFEDWNYCADNNLPSPCDSGTHGSHVAGIVAGTGAANAAYTGVAPGAALVGFMITNGPDHGQSVGSKAGALHAIDWILANQNETPVEILTISFGFGPTVDGTDALELAMDKAWLAGVTNFKSTGNSGPERGTVTIPGGARGIIATASLYDSGEQGFRLSDYSSRGPTVDGRLKPDLAAPGSNIMAVGAGTGNGYISQSGTSMASPFAAGTAALMLDANPMLDPDDIRDALIATADDWGPEGHDIDFGNGRINSLKAVQSVTVARALAEGWDYEDLMAFNVTGPEPPAHAYMEVSGVQTSTTFQLDDATKPVALTFIAHAHPAQVDTPVAVPYADLLVVLDPSGAPVLGLDPSTQTVSAGVDLGVTRQGTILFQPTTSGTYTVQVVNPISIQSIHVDVTGGLPDSVEPLTFPDVDSYVENVTATLEAYDDAVESLPAPWALLPLAAAVFLARRRGQ